MIKLLSKAVASGVVYARTQIDTPERTRIRSRSGELLHSTPKSASVKREISKNLEKVTRLTAPYPVRVRSRSGFSEVVQSRWIPVSYVSNLSKRADTSQGLNPEAVEVERRIDRRLMISAGAFGIGIASAAYPPLIILALPCILYTTAPFFKDAYKAVFEDNKIRVSVLDAIVVTGMIATGRWFLMTVTAFLGNGSFKLMMKAQDNSLKGVIDIFRNQSKTAWLKQSDHEVETPIESLVVGDIIVIHAGETVPVDGIIHEGICSIDQHALTGESQPAERGPGDPVLATSIILSGKIEVRVQTVGTETVAARIADIINNTSDYSSSLQMRGQAISDKGSVPTLVVGALALPFAGLSGALAVLCSALGWNMRIIAPISTLNFLRLTSEHGILIKDGRALESLDGVDTIVFDKTGTLTLDQPHVAQIYAFGSYPEDLILTLAAAAESRQSHPIARAIIKAAKERNLTLPGMEDAHYEIGYGIQVTVAGKSVQVGSARYMGMSDIEMPVEAEERQQIAYESGHSMVFVAIEGVLAGALELHATIRPEAKDIIQRLRERNIQLYIISGDHKKPTARLASELGIDHYFAEILPENKAQLVESLQAEGRKVCFVGDGINDSIALKKANVSISLSGASTAATDTAQIVLMDGSLKQLDRLFQISTSFERNMKNNLITSVAPGIICMGGVFFLHWGIVSAIFLYNIGLLAGVTNSMLPLASNQLERWQKRRSKLPAGEGTQE